MVILAPLLLLAFAIWILAFYSRRKRTRIAEFPQSWRSILSNDVKFYAKLDLPAQRQFEKRIIEFLEYCTITGVGIAVTDEDRLLVAASAVIPIFGFPGWRYTNLNEVLLYPDAFNDRYETSGEDRTIGGMVGWGALNRTMILSRNLLHQGFENEHTRNNVGIHEFVHLIDKLDGSTDGLPELLIQRHYAIPWMKMIHDEMKRIHAGRSDVNPYGATNEAEFFSVISEYFFNQPELLEKKHPELFQMLEKVFHQDPIHSRSSDPSV